MTENVAGKANANARAPFAGCVGMSFSFCASDHDAVRANKLKGKRR